MKLNLTAVSSTAIEPTYGTDQAACFDLCADILGRDVKTIDSCAQESDDAVVILPGGRALIPTGFIFHIPDGYQMKINPRSGLAWKNGITILNAPATIDSDYDKETFVVLHNASTAPITIRHGERIAQAELMPVIRCNFKSSGKRTGGFGSTGI